MRKFIVLSTEMQTFFLLTGGGGGLHSAGTCVFISMVKFPIVVVLYCRYPRGNLLMEIVS